MATNGEGRERDEDTGQYRAEWSDAAFLDALADAGDLASTTAVADRVGCTETTAYRRLHDLADEGLVEKVQPSRSIFWRAVD